MEERRAVVALDDGDGAARPEQSPDDLQCLTRSGQVLEDEADEGVIEQRRPERQGEKVGLEETDARQPGTGDPPPGEADGVGRDVHGHETRSSSCGGRG